MLTNRLESFESAATIHEIELNEQVCTDDRFRPNGLPNEGVFLTTCAPISAKEASWIRIT